MYGQNGGGGDGAFPVYNYSLLDMTATAVPTMTMSTTFPLNIPGSMGEYDLSLSASAIVQTNGGINTGSSSSYGSPTSLASCDLQTANNFMQRSVSSLSLLLNKNNEGRGPPPPHFIWSHLNTDFSDTSDGSTPVRRACSTGDLQGGINVLQSYRRSESPMSNEESCSSIIEGMSKACRYSPEEKRERIDKYRTKRNHRNFNKTIKYACRKTLADSRPRIRGRFARNDEILEKVAANQGQWPNHHHQAGHGEYQDQDQEDPEDQEENWANFLEAFTANLIP